MNNQTRKVEINPRKADNPQIDMSSRAERLRAVRKAHGFETDPTLWDRTKKGAAVSAIALTGVGIETGAIGPTESNDPVLSNTRNEIAGIPGAQEHFEQWQVPDNPEDMRVVIDPNEQP